jgi:hypothetical protein
MFEALSLAEQLPEPAGRFTKPMQPAGFEALAGVPIKAPTRPPPSHLAVVPAPKEGAVHSASRVHAAQIAARERAAAERAREEADAERARLEAIRQAETAVNQAKADEAQARKAWEKAKDRLDEAERELKRRGETKTGRHSSNR